MAIYHIGMHGYKKKPTRDEMLFRIAAFEKEFASQECMEEYKVGEYFGNEDFHDIACVKFRDLDAYREHLLTPHGATDEETILRTFVARIRAFDILTADEPADAREQIVELYKQRWEKFPGVAQALRELNADLPYL